MFDYLFVLIYVLLGAGIKFIDDAFDRQVFNKKIALFLAPVLGLLWAYTMSLSIESATILAAVVLGVFFTGKIDNKAFWAGFFVILVVLILFGVFDFLWLPLIILTIAGVIDERGNDFVDRKGIKNKMVFYFFKERFVMKLSVLLLAALNIFAWIYLIAFLAFDIAYSIVNRISLKRAQTI